MNKCPHCYLKALSFLRNNVTLSRCEPSKTMRYFSLEYFGLQQDRLLFVSVEWDFVRQNFCEIKCIAVYEVKA